MKHVNSRRAWLVFGVSVFAYMTAVMQRTTLGVAGVDAAARFDSSAALLSTLAVVQLIVYAGLQIPVGILIDRVGPKWLISVGCTLMVAGQLVLSFAPDIPTAVLGRIFVGAGDAAVFISVIRLVNSWFSGPIVPQLSQWVGNVGQLGQVLSALPFAWVLHTFGWSPAFSVAAALSFSALVLSIVFLTNRPPDAPGSGQVASMREALRMLGPTLRRPGTQLGFWSHFVSQSSGTVFTIFWGFPFLVSAVGLDRGTASAFLVVIVISGMVAGPILGILSARFPLRRSNLVLGITATLGVVWGGVLLWPGVPPIWLIAILTVTLGIGGPGSLIGFDFARSFNPARSLGSANGVVNVGGFMASFVMLFLIGVILDVQYDVGLSTTLYSMDAFRLAFSIQYVVIGSGVLFLLRARRHTRRRLQEDEGISVAPLWVALVGQWRRRRP
ncbi:Nitrate/nitrite transporter NarK [Agreia bicolorata]|uniref:Nitrate/nitrite transporter NarK n=1 Tax=Agreia bicolorata TaxID=110935 RepID=A0A1T4X8J9_9MICO|nr:Nitrate/nitrite transporter NarK [Agreia bicolorata]